MYKFKDLLMYLSFDFMDTSVTRKSSWFLYDIVLDSTDSSRRQSSASIIEVSFNETSIKSSTNVHFNS